MSNLAISDDELKAATQAQILYKKLTREANEAKKDWEFRETSLMMKIKAGATFTGALQAIIETAPGICRPKWKELYTVHMSEHGFDAAQLEQAAKDVYPPEPNETLVILPK